VELEIELRRSVIIATELVHISARHTRLADATRNASVRQSKPKLEGQGEANVGVYELAKRRARPDWRKAYYTARERQHIMALRAGRMRSCHRAGTELCPVQLATTEGSKVATVLN
jgi:hypothetical protein